MAIGVIVEAAVSVQRHQGSHTSSDLHADARSHAINGTHHERFNINICVVAQHTIRSNIQDGIFIRGVGIIDCYWSVVYPGDRRGDRAH